MRLFSKSDLIISKFCIVLILLPICPAIFLPLKTLPGSWFWPVDPCALWETETPCDALSPEKLCLFITPANPLPIVFDCISTNFWSLNNSKPISLPSLNSEILSTLNSFKNFFGSVDFFAKKPFICFLIFEVLIFPKPTCIASYPRLSFVITFRILPFSTSITVTGSDKPESRNSLVIPIFFPINPILMVLPIILFLYLHQKPNLIS